MSYSIWGKIQSKAQLARGCVTVSCAGHGGIIVAKNTISTHPYFEKIRQYDFSNFRQNDGSYAFEEDLDANIILANLPQQSLSSHYPSCETHEGYERFHNNCLFALKNSYPELFTMITGIELSIFDSQVLFQRHLKAVPDLIYRDGAFSGYNIPLGYVAITIKGDSGVEKETYLIERELYEREIKMPKGYLGYFPIDPKLLNTPFEIDFWTPGSTHADRKDDYFYISHIRKIPNDGYRVLAYNYKTKAKMCFEMSQQYYDSSNVSKTGIQVNEANTPVNEPFITVSSMTAEQFIAA